MSFLRKELRLCDSSTSPSAKSESTACAIRNVVIDRGEIRKRKKKASKKFRERFGHTPLSLDEDLPWKCRRPVIGTGTGALPVMDEVRREAQRREIELVILPTAQAIKVLKRQPAETNAVLHVTC